MREPLFEVGRAARDGRGRVVQLVRQAGRELAECQHLLALLVEPRRLAHAVGHPRHEPLADLGHPLQHLPKVPLVEHGQPQVLDHLALAGERLHPRERQEPRDLARADGPKREPLAVVVDGEDLERAAERDEHLLGRVAAPERALTGGERPLVGRLRQPGEVGGRLVAEFGDGGEVGGGEHGSEYGGVGGWGVGGVWTGRGRHPHPPPPHTPRLCATTSRGGGGRTRRRPSPRRRPRPRA